MASKCIYLKEEQHLDSMLHQNYMYHNGRQRCDHHGQMTCKERYESKQNIIIIIIIIIIMETLFVFLNVQL